MASTLPPLFQNGDISYFNFQPSSLKNWRNAVAGVRAGLSRARLLCLGDSTTAGVGSTALYNGNYPVNYPSYLTKQLNAYFAPASNNSLIGTKNIDPVANPLYDSRLSMQTGWSQAGATSLGGPMFWCSTANATWSFTPTSVVDTIEIYTIGNFQPGTVTVNVDGGASLGTISSNTGGGIVKTTYTVTKGLHTINIVQATGTMYLAGVIAYDSTTPAIDVVTSGYASGLVSDISGPAGNPWSCINVLGVYKPSLTVIALRINDWLFHNSVTSYQANLTALVNAVLAAGSDVVLLGSPPSNGSVQSAPQTDQEQYNIAQRAVALATNVPLIDVAKSWASYSANLMSDGVHPKQIGYSKYANDVFRGITP